MSPNTSLRVLDSVIMDNEALIAQHLSWLRRITDRRDTHKHRRDNIRRIARRLPCRLIDATPQHLDAWQAALNVSTSSVQTYTAHARAFYRWCHDTGLRGDNPAEGLPMPKVARRLPRPIPERDLQLAFRCARGDMTVWLALAGWCGLRAGEIARLRGEDIIADDDGMYLRVDGKGGKERIVPVPEAVCSLVRSVLRRGPLFHRPCGTPVTPNYVTATCGLFFRGIGLAYTLHTLRHRFGTELYRLSRDIRQVQDVMGHSTPGTTSLYVAIAARGSTKTINRLGRSLPKAS